MYQEETPIVFNSSIAIPVVIGNLSGYLKTLGKSHSVCRG